MTDADMFRPEFGQGLCGNAWGEYAITDAHVAHQLYELSRAIGERNAGRQTHGLFGGEWGYGQEFENDVFEMHPYWWGECLCGAPEDANAHARYCRIERPNFRCGELEIHWYKYIGRGMSANLNLTHEQYREVFLRCFASLEKNP